MSKLRKRIEAVRLELAAGQGGTIHPHPVPLEPTYVPFASSGIDDTKVLVSYPVLRVERDLQFLRIRPSEQDSYSTDLAENLILSLNPSNPVAFEVLGTEGEALIQVAAESRDANIISGQIEAYYPNCEVFESEDIVQNVAERLRLARAYRLRRSHLFPLREGHRNDTYTALIGSLSSIRPEDVVLFQTLFVPVKGNWQRNILRVARDPSDPSRSVFSDVPQLPRKADTKASRPLFAVAIRTAASSEELLNMLEGSFLTQFESEDNHLEKI